MKLKKFRLLILFLILFGLDKIILIPSVRNLLTSENIGNPYIETFNNSSATYLEDIKYKDKKRFGLLELHVPLFLSIFDCRLQQAF